MKAILLSERALIARINRKLIKEEETLCKTRGERWHSDLGYYYIVNIRFNSVTAAHLDIEKLGRELGLIRDYETLAA
jgi:hypothetical protein